MSRTLVIYFSPPGVLDYPLNNPIFFEAYTELIEYWHKYGVHAVIARADSYLKDGFFSSYFEWDARSRSFIKIESPIQADLIWNRDSENTIPRVNDNAVLNHPDFDEICRDKIKSYEFLKEISGKTILVHSYEEAKKNLAEFEGDKIVLKPRSGEGAHGVAVIDKADLSPDLYQNWQNILMQEFLDSSNGIEGLVEGLHEINVTVVNGLFAGARIKKPPEGAFVSSATGAVVGQVWGLHFEEIPQELWADIQVIDQRLDHYFPRLFRADFVRTTSGTYKLIEINSRPGVNHPDKEGREFYWNFNGAVADAVITYLQDKPAQAS